jgi:hypothetical protein
MIHRGNEANSLDKKELLQDRLGATIKAVVSVLIKHAQNNVPPRAAETQHTRQSATYDHQNRSNMNRFQGA